MASETAEIQQLSGLVGYWTGNSWQQDSTLKCSFKQTVLAMQHLLEWITPEDSVARGECDVITLSRNYDLKYICYLCVVGIAALASVIYISINYS